MKHKVRSHTVYPPGAPPLFPQVKRLTGTTKQLDNASPANIAALEKLTEEALASKAVTLDRLSPSSNQILF